MSRETVIHLLHQVKDHYAIHQKYSDAIFSFHGGEPLLAGLDFFNFFVEKAKEILLPANIKPIFVIQTNGTLLNEDWCEFFYQNQVHIGVSLDGKKEDNDEFRVYHNGKGSYDDVIEGLDMVRSYKDLKDGLGVLAVINIKSDPLETYEFFKGLGVKAVDFLLPDYTCDEKDEWVGEEKTFYADWLIAMFNRWIDDPDRPRIRFFNGLIEAIVGGDFSADTLGEMSNDLLVIETNGDYEAVDVLKICGDEFTKAGANVSRSTIDEALQTELASLYQRSHSVLAAKCEKCLIKQVCGGGYLPHRFSNQNGFNNPSVYCEDLMKTITHIQNKVLDMIPPEILAKTEVQRVTYAEAKRAVVDVPLNPTMEHAELLQFVKNPK